MSQLLTWLSWEEKHNTFSLMALCGILRLWLPSLSKTHHLNDAPKEILTL